jgi:uncharacterized coiled-coil protein SlyX
MASDHDIKDAPTGLEPVEARAYLDARTQGLCHEGALEVALGVRGTAGSAVERFDTVEFKLAHLERAVQELSDVVYRQQRQIDAALALNQRLRDQLQDLEGRTPDASPVEIPPHY